MSRKDYIKIAVAISIERFNYDDIDGIDAVVWRLARIFKEDNSRFDIDKFEAACKENPYA